MIEKETMGYIIYGFAEKEERKTIVKITTSFTIDCEVEQIVQWQAGSNDCSDY